MHLRTEEVYKQWLAVDLILEKSLFLLLPMKIIPFQVYILSRFFLWYTVTENSLIKGPARVGVPFLVGASRPSIQNVAFLKKYLDGQRGQVDGRRRVCHRSYLIFQSLYWIVSGLYGCFKLLWNWRSVK